MPLVIFTDDVRDSGGRAARRGQVASLAEASLARFPPGSFTGLRRPPLASRQAFPAADKQVVEEGTK